MNLEHISGFHQYDLTEQAHLTFASQSLCDLLDLVKADLMAAEHDGYAASIYPADLELYREFLHRLQIKEQTLTAEYRVIRKDGTLIWVKDTCTSYREGDALKADSVLTDITDLKLGQEDLSVLNDALSCGVIRYTCEKQPRITYMNQQMRNMLCMPSDPEDAELYMSNLFLIIPAEERRRFSKYLNRVFSADVPLTGELSLLRCDGSRVHAFGWITKNVNEQGETEFQSVCLDITERKKLQSVEETRRYQSVLSGVYDKIFAFNTAADTVKCVHCEPDSSFHRIKDLEMRKDDLLEKWITESVSPKECDEIRAFFARYYNAAEESSIPPRITYQAKAGDGQIHRYTGMFIRVNSTTSFFCCRKVQDLADTTALKVENEHLREEMRDMVMRFSDGIAAFEVTPDHLVKPLYASENVSEFFGYTQEEWLELTQRFTPLDLFASNGETTVEELEELLRKGEAAFSYFDYKTEQERKITAICSQKEPNQRGSRYVMLYSADPASQTEDSKAGAGSPVVSIRTFGYFDVFVGDQAIAFRNKKSKELLALLVDRRGGFITSEEAISYLWEDEFVNPLTLARYRKVALRLKKILEEYGIADIIESVDGKRRIVPEKVDCDLYNYLTGDEAYEHLFRGSYLTNYSWGEYTLGEL